MKKFLVLDTETTGVDLDARVVQLAWCEISEEMEIIDSFDTYINPGIEIPCDASGISGIRTEDVRRAPSIDQIVWPEGEIVMIAHNAPFDLKFVRDYMNVTDTICTLALAKRMLPDAPNHKLQTLSCYCGLAKEAAHSAIGDVWTTLSLLDFLTDGSGMSMQQLANYLKKPVLVENINFGKHKGLRIVDLPLGYRHWLLSLPDLDKDMRFSVEKTLN